MFARVVFPGSLLAREMKRFRLVFAVLPPCPMLREVIGILERDLQMVHVPGGSIGKVACIHEGKVEFLRAAADGRSPQARLIAGAAIVGHYQAAPVGSIERHHFGFVSRAERLQKSGAVGNQPVGDLCGCSAIRLAGPLAGQRLHLLESRVAACLGGQRHGAEGQRKKTKRIQSMPFHATLPVLGFSHTIREPRAPGTTPEGPMDEQEGGSSKKLTRRARTLNRGIDLRQRFYRILAWLLRQSKSKD